MGVEESRKKVESGCPVTEVTGNDRAPYGRRNCVDRGGFRLVGATRGRARRAGADMMRGWRMTRYCRSDRTPELLHFPRVAGGEQPGEIGLAAALPRVVYLGEHLILESRRLNRAEHAHRLRQGRVLHLGEHKCVRR